MDVKMTPEQLREKIEVSPNETIRKNGESFYFLELTSPSYKSRRLNGLIQIYEFALRQVEGWGRLFRDSDIKIPSQSEIKERKALSESDVQVYPDEVDATRLFEPYYDFKYLVDMIPMQVLGYTSHLPSIESPTSNYDTDLRHTGGLNDPRVSGEKYKLFYDQRESEILVKLYKEDRRLVNGAYHYFALRHMGLNDAPYKDPNFLPGFIYAANLDTAGLSIASELSQYDKEALRTERANWLEYKKELEGERDRYRKKVEEELNFYKERLAWEEPSKFWEKRADLLNFYGYIALTSLVSVTVVACFFIYNILWMIPDYFKKETLGNWHLVIRWSLVFAVLVILLGFIIQSIAKVMFSNFHLARDAEERKALTDVFLALVLKSEAKEDDRKIILTALFGRAETGLLKNDSSPTLPIKVEPKVGG